MYNRKYSLKTRYNFNKVLRRGRTFSSRLILVKYLSVSPSIFKNEQVDKKFAIITSNKFSKKAVVQNRVRRIIGEAIRLNEEKFPPYYYYIFIPKKTFLVSGKVKYNVKNFNTQIDTFLSEIPVA